MNPTTLWWLEHTPAGRRTQRRILPRSALMPRARAELEREEREERERQQGHADLLARRREAAYESLQDPEVRARRQQGR